MEDFCKKIPKIELHAHLNGCISSETLKELGCSSISINEYQKIHSILDKSERTSDDCFSVFQVAHKVTNTPQAVYKAATSVINDFYNDGCVYLELRTTPRAEKLMTKSQYIDAVINAINDNKKDIIVKLILSIDRRHDYNTGLETVMLYELFDITHPNVIVGIDLCGNPYEGEFNLKLFNMIKKMGIKMTLHCAETNNTDEVKQMLKLKPDRIGHGTFIHPEVKGTEECWKMITESRIPLECCLTSNVVCGTVKDYKSHHLQHWRKHNLPYSISTDDTGVFCTSLSNEYYLTHQHFGLNKEDLIDLSYLTIEYIFAKEFDIKGILSEKLFSFKEKYGF